MSFEKYGKSNTICILIKCYDRTDIKLVRCNSKCERAYIAFRTKKKDLKFGSQNKPTMRCVKETQAKGFRKAKHRDGQTDPDKWGQATNPRNQRRRDWCRTKENSSQIALNVTTKSTFRH